MQYIRARGGSAKRWRSEELNLRREEQKIGECGKRLGERRVSEEGRGIAWKSADLNLDGLCGQRHCLERWELNGWSAC